MVRWVHSFVQDRQAAICLDGKRDELKPVRSGIPQGSCVSLILVAFFTTPMGDDVTRNTNMRIANSPELSTTVNEGKAQVNPLTLYVDDSSIAASAPNCGDHLS